MNYLEVTERINRFIEKDKRISNIDDAAENMEILCQIINQLYEIEFNSSSLYELHGLINAIFNLLYSLTGHESLTNFIDVPDGETTILMSIASGVLFPFPSEQNMEDLALRRLISNTNFTLNNLEQFYDQDFAFLNGNREQFLKVFIYVLNQVKIIADYLLEQGQGAQQSTQYHT